MKGGLRLISMHSAMIKQIIAPKNNSLGGYLYV